MEKKIKSINIELNATAFRQWRNSDFVRIQCKNRSYNINTEDILDFRLIL